MITRDTLVEEINIVNDEWNQDSFQCCVLTINCVYCSSKIKAM